MDWTMQQQQYQEWLALPSTLRPVSLKSKEQVAKQLETDKDTLVRWEFEPNFWDEVFSRARAIIGHELGSILMAMVTEAKSGSVQAAKLCLEALGVHSDSLSLKHEFQDEQLMLLLHPDTPKAEEEAQQQAALQRVALKRKPKLPQARQRGRGRRAS